MQKKDKPEITPPPDIPYDPTIHPKPEIIPMPEKPQPLAPDPAPTVPGPEIHPEREREF